MYVQQYTEGRLIEIYQILLVGGVGESQIVLSGKRGMEKID